MAVLVAIAMFGVLAVAVLTLVVVRRGGERQLRRSVLDVEARATAGGMRDRHHIESGQG